MEPEPPERIQRGTQFYHPFGTSQQAYHQGQKWIAYWRRRTNDNDPVCYEIGCRKDGREGAHVQRAHLGDWFIVPSCSGHNTGQNGKWLLCKDVLAVRANATLLERIAAAQSGLQQRCRR